jgi:hypothetical protein
MFYSFEIWDIMQQAQGNISKLRMKNKGNNGINVIALQSRRGLITFKIFKAKVRMSGNISIRSDYLLIKCKNK